MGVGLCLGGSPSNRDRFPTQSGKPGKWEDILQPGESQGILNRLEKTEKLLEFETIIISYFLVIFK